MISISFYKNSESYTINSYKELIPLCKKLREKDKDTPYTIYIKSNENEILNLKFEFSYFHIVFLGKGTLDSNLYANKLDENNQELTTWKTAALKISGSHNILENLTIRNISGDSHIKGQEVALGVYGDDNLFINCRFVSQQDTLFVGPLPDDLCTRYIDFLPQDERYFEGNAFNYFEACTIEGTIDFIFGAGKAVFDNCILKTIHDERKETYVVAPSHSLKDDYGYLFYECKFLIGDEVEEQSTYLARPWRDYGKAVFAYCFYDKHINKEGFHDWSNINRIRTARFEEHPLQEGRVEWTYNKKEESLDKKYIDSVMELRKSIGNKQHSKKAIV